MKHITLLLITIMLFLGCSKRPDAPVPDTLKPEFTKSRFDELPNWHEEDYSGALNSFLDSCKTTKTRALYEELCKSGAEATDAKKFFMENFTPYKIDATDAKDDGLLTGYYEPLLKGSLTKKEPYVYPVYATPRDLIVVSLASQYPELQNYRLRGRYDGNNKVVPYYSRKELSSRTLDADIICYVDSRIELFFLEVQGSGRVLLDSGEVIYVGFDNLNGYKYSSIGKYLIDAGEITYAQASMKGIKNWCDANPARVDELLNHNESVIFFKKKDKPATGSLGVVLTPERSVAIDQRYLPLGSMLYMSAKIKEKELNRIVMAQDTGGAIKGSVRADLFFGYGDEAGSRAGGVKAPLKLWILLPKSSEEESL
ncbi:MAG: rane-bound lytic murein transglycosylase [Campylobacterota bacterium]|nr:rane-bound lytic murein transglycosylase [Campylobacterota bacterium]MDQ1268037.1 rane-bound lytic murein transglycosylase [Campylobacterota bacterium]MDQ1337802.1 rane-bound lytic murein transglycosylase [Campylobacterota bacterium]